MKKILIFAIIIVAVGGYFYVSKPVSSVATPTLSPSVVVSPTPTPTPVATSTPVSATSTPKAGSFTMVQVAQHKTEADCYTAIGGSVYDLTAFVKKHPGGDRAIFQICGIDGTSAFQNQHDGQQKQMDLLATFKIGVVVK